MLSCGIWQRKSFKSDWKHHLPGYIAEAGGLDLLKLYLLEEKFNSKWGNCAKVKLGLSYFGRAAKALLSPVEAGVTRGAVICGSSHTHFSTSR